MDHLDIFQIIWILYRSFRYYSYHMDTFKSFVTLFKSFRHFSDHPGTLQIIRTLFRSSGYFSDHVDTLQNIRISVYSSDHRYFLDHTNNFLICRTPSKNFLVNIVDAMTSFFLTPPSAGNMTVEDIIALSDMFLLRPPQACQYQQLRISFQEVSTKMPPLSSLSLFQTL